MKNRRIFLAINLPEQVKKKLLEFRRENADLPVYWTKEANLHITLIFIGYVDNEEMLEICRVTKEVVQNHQSFEIILRQICLGPFNRPPRMIWAEGEKSSQLAQLKNDLEEKLFDSVNSGFNHRGNRVFQPHITLARIRQEEWRSLSDKPKIEKEVSLVFPVETVEVMESHLSRGGVEYAVLESVELRG
jgi:2'-5' RNA ligase